MNSTQCPDLSFYTCGCDCRMILSTQYHMFHTRIQFWYTHTHARTHTHKVYSKKINCHMLPPKYIPSFPQLPHTAQSLAVSWLANKVTLKFLQCTESCNCLLRTLRDQPGYQGQRNATTRFYRCPFSDNQVSMHYEGYTSKLYTPCI